MADIRRDPARERERCLADRKGVAGIKADADAGPRLLAEADQLLAAEILVILDRQPDAGSRGGRAVLLERGADIGDQLGPFRAPGIAIAAEHRGEADADDRRAGHGRLA